MALSSTAFLSMRRIATSLLPAGPFARAPLTVVGLPALSPTMETGAVAKWKVDVGQAISRGDPLFDVQTDKTVMTYENSRYKGYVARLLAKEGDTLPVTGPVMLLVDDAADVASEEVRGWAPPPPPEGAAAAAAGGGTPAPPHDVANAPHAAPTPSAAPYATPIARVEAAKMNVPLTSLRPGKSIDDPITLQHVSSSEPPPLARAPPPLSEVPFEDVAVTPMRRTIAQRLQESKNTAPHYYISCTAVVDAALAVLTQLNAKSGGTFKVRFNDFVTKAVARACLLVPDMNASWHGTHIRRYGRVDVAMAVATPEGLFTPVIRGVEAKGLAAIAAEVRTLAERARAGKLDPAEYAGGTITVSNLGGLGVESFTAILNPPHAAIVAVGAIDRRAAVTHDAATDTWRATGAVEAVARLTVSVDHRVVDGAVAAKWVAHLKDALENPLSLLL